MMHYILKLIFIIFSVLLVFGLFLSYPIYRARTIAAKIIAQTVPFEQHPPNPDQYILVGGDSTAVGVGAVNPRESTAGRLGQQFKTADITNLGFTGAQLKDLLQILSSIDRHYDLILLQIGANDITFFTPYETIREELAQIITTSKRIGTKVIILTAGNVGAAPVFHWPLSRLMTERTLKVRKIFMEEIAKHKNVIYVDLFKDKEHDPFEKNIQKYYAPDSFHLTGAGYGSWYLSIQNHL